MAAGVLSNNPNKGGPCKGECKHRDCAITRRMVAEVCRFCDKPIGYQSAFYTDPQNARDVRGDSPESGPALVHAFCLEDYYDRETAGNCSPDVEGGLERKAALA